jgi:hypothetical protein
MWRSLERGSVRLSLVGVFPYLVPVIAVLRMLSWGVALPLAVAWIVLLDQLGRYVGRRRGRRAAQEFNERFPEGSTQRPEALQVLAGLNSLYLAPRHMKQALGLPGEPQWIPRIRSRPVPAAAMPSDATTADGAPPDAEVLHLGGASAPPVPTPERPPGGQPEYLPLELHDRPAPQPPPSVRLVLAIEPVAQPVAAPERSESAPQEQPPPRDQPDQPPAGDTPAGLAGSHNVNLFESSGGVLELRFRVPSTVTSLYSVFKLLLQGVRDTPCAHVKFDRSRGRRPRYVVTLLPGYPLGRLPVAFRKPRPLDDIAAVQLAPNPTVGGDQPGATCRLRPRLHEASHPVLELAPCAEAAWARQTAERLARFIGVPLEDHVRTGSA